jgi:hypothetical protein
MNSMNHEVFDEIHDWVINGEWKKEESGGLFEKRLNAHYFTYTSPWFRDLTDEEMEGLDEDEDDFYTFHLVIYIWQNNRYKIEFDEGLFNLMYKGYDTEADRNAWNEFKKLAREKGVLLEW